MEDSEVLKYGKVASTQPYTKSSWSLFKPGLDAFSFYFQKMMVAIKSIKPDADDTQGGYPLWIQLAYQANNLEFYVCMFTRQIWSVNGMLCI